MNEPEPNIEIEIPRDKKLIEELKTRTDLPEVGSNWRHFKGHEYRVLNIGVDEETEKLVVIYTDASGKIPIVWVRSVDKWNSYNENNIKRFQKID